MKFLLIWLLLFAQANSRSGPPNLAPHKASFENGVYHNRVLDIRFRVPSHLNVDRQTLSIEKKAFGGMIVLLDAKDEPLLPRTPDTVMIIIDQPQFSDGSVFLEKLTKNFKELGSQVLQERAEVILAGKKLYRGDFRNPNGGFFTVFTTVHRGYNLVFIFTASDERRRDVLLESMKTLELKDVNVRVITKP